MKTTNLFYTFTKLMCTVILLVSFVACSPSEDFRDDESEDDPVIINETPCPAITPIGYEIPYSGHPKFIFILIDASGSYKQWTNSSLSLLSEALPEVLNPGDSLYIGWIGLKPDDPRSIFFRDGIDIVPFPLIIPPPIIVEDTLTPTLDVGIQPTPTYPITDALVPALTATAEVLQTRQAHENYILSITKAAPYCEIEKINKVNSENIMKWEQLQENTSHEFFDMTLLPALANSKMQIYDTETRIYESIYYASNIIQNEIKNSIFYSYKILIFSDMFDQRSVPPGSLNINFNNTQVYIEMMHCDRAILCQERREKWTEEFEISGAASVNFRYVAETTKESIVNDLLEGE